MKLVQLFTDQITETEKLNILKAGSINKQDFLDCEFLFDDEEDMEDSEDEFADNQGLDLDKTKIFLSKIINSNSINSFDYTDKQIKTLKKIDLDDLFEKIVDQLVDIDGDANEIVFITSIPKQMFKI